MVKLIVHLVHGTQFYAWRKPRIPWVEDEGDGEDGSVGAFRHGLRRRLAERGFADVDFDVVPWSGRNRHGARLEAAQELRRHVLDLTLANNGSRHVVVAHSHGGNACLLALKDAGELPQRLSGIVCFSTPFLVVREAKWALAATFAWMFLALIGVSQLVSARFERAIVAIPLDTLALALVIYLLRVVLWRYYDVTRWTQAPEQTAVPVLIVRCPGDEASSGLGFVAILARVLYTLEHLAAWPLRALQRHPLQLWLSVSLASIALAVAAGVLAPFGRWLAANARWIVALLLAPWLLGLPARVLVYGLAYGVDLLGLPLMHSISAETTPLGRWESHLVATSDSDEWRAAHSEPYRLRVVQNLAADWIADQLAEEPHPQPTFALD